MSAPATPLPHQRSGGPGTGGGPGGGRSSNMPVILGSIIAAAAVVVIIVILVAMSGGGGGDNANGDHTTPPATATTTASTAPTGSSGGDIVKGDQSRTIDAGQCTNAHNNLINPDKPDVITMPNVQFLYVDSVVACFKAAGWSYTVKHVDEQQWGQGTVTDQSPKYLDDYKPKSGQKITIWVSTGKGAN